MLFFTSERGDGRPDLTGPLRTCHKTGAHLINEGTEAQRPVAKWHALIPQRFSSTFPRPDSVLEIGWGTGQAPSLVHGRRQQTNMATDNYSASTCGTCCEEKNKGGCPGPDLDGTLLEGVACPLKWVGEGEPRTASHGPPRRNPLGGLRQSRVAEQG